MSISTSTGHRLPVSIRIGFKIWIGRQTTCQLFAQIWVPLEAFDLDETGDARPQVFYPDGADPWPRGPKLGAGKGLSIEGGTIMPFRSSAARFPDGAFADMVCSRSARTFLPQCCSACLLAESISRPRACHSRHPAQVASSDQMLSRWVATGLGGLASTDHKKTGLVESRKGSIRSGRMEWVATKKPCRQESPGVLLARGRSYLSSMLHPPTQHGALPTSVPPSRRAIDGWKNRAWSFP